jgi:hypothetical protein
MSEATTQSAPHGAKGREALEQSERKANQTEPENYKDDAADKIVEIPPVDGDNQPIKGLDPK